MAADPKIIKYMDDLEGYKKFAEEFARKAGAIMLQNFRLGMKKEWKADNSPVTETDLKINALLIEEIKKNFPSHGIKGEEESNLNGNEEYIWVCDPVDGTVPFSHGIPISTFSLALTKNGESVVGVIYDPFQDRLYSAQKDGGAYLNGNKISVSINSGFKGSVCEMEMSDISKFDVSKLFMAMLSERIKVLKFVSVIYPSALVAAGELLFTIYPGGNAHDAASVKIIVEEAGGKVTDIYGNEQKYDREINGFIASNGVMHDQIVELSKQLVKLNSINKK